MGDPQSALVVVAHPDDCEFACGGTVAKWTSRGVRVELIVVTNGALGSHDVSIPAAKLTETREREQLEAARDLGISDVIFYGLPDGMVRADEDLVERIVTDIRARRPGRVLTHDPWKQYMLHPDHLEVGRAVVLASVRAREPRIDRGRDLPEWRPDALWLFRAQDPDHVEDTSATSDQQLQALLRHRSQAPTSMGFEPGDEAGEMRFVRWLEDTARETGAPAGYARGEAFRRVGL